MFCSAVAFQSILNVVNSPKVLCTENCISGLQWKSFSNSQSLAIILFKLYFTGSGSLKSSVFSQSVAIIPFS